LLLEIGKLLQANLKLSELSLHWPFPIPEIEFQILLLENLKVLSLSTRKFSIETLENLIQKNVHLKDLELKDMNMGTEEMERLYASLSFQQNHLKSLKLQGLGYFQDLLVSMPSFPNLKILIIVPSHSSASIVSHGTDSLLCDILSRLLKLEILKVPIYGDGPLHALSAVCPLLKELDIMDGREVSDQGISELAMHCLRLYRVSLGSAIELTDAGILSLVSVLGQYSHSRIALPFRRFNLSEKLLQEIPRCTPSLEVITNIPNLSIQNLLEFVGKMDKLIVLGIVSLEGFGVNYDVLVKGSRRLKMVNVVQ